jgi:hypothetical protein
MPSDAKKEFNLDLAASVCVEDKESEMEAVVLAGLISLFITVWFTHQRSGVDRSALAGGALLGYDFGLVAVSVFVSVGFINAGNI